MQKKVLTEQALYYGDVSMPKDWEIDGIDLAHHILHSTFKDTDILPSRTLDKLNVYIKDFINLNYDMKLIDQKIWGNIYKPQQKSPPLLHIDPVDLKHSPDFILLYGVQVEDCNVRIHYDDNRRKGKSWDIPLTNNKFIMFPSTNMYYITNDQKDALNFVQSITYDYL